MNIDLAFYWPLDYVWGRNPFRLSYRLAPRMKTIRQLWDETPQGSAILDSGYQMLCVVMERKTRYTCHECANVIANFWEMDCVQAAEAIANYHDAMKTLDANYWELLWEERRKRYLE